MRQLVSQICLVFEYRFCVDIYFVLFFSPLPEARRLSCEQRGEKGKWTDLLETESRAEAANRAMPAQPSRNDGRCFCPRYDQIK